MSGTLLHEPVADYVLYDLETTGLSCRDDAVIELAAVKVINGTITEEFSSLINPGRHIPAEAEYINGISDAMVRNAPDTETVLGNFLRFAGDMALAGHNIHTFDMKFLRRDCLELFGLELENDYIDTLPLARLILPEREGYRLTELAWYYGISPDGAHRALNDVRMNQQVYERLRAEYPAALQDGRVRLCPCCGSLMTRRKGKYGTFLGCTGYPACRHTEKT